MKKYQVEWLEKQVGVVWARDPKDAERQAKEAMRQSANASGHIPPSTLTSLQEIQPEPGESWKP